MIYFVEYTDKMKKPWQAAYAWMFFVKIKPEYKNDIGLFQHELEHVRQFWVTLGLHQLLVYIQKYRLWSEVKAYKKQLQFEPAINNVERYRKIYAGFIANNYNISINIDEAENLLK